jgi:NADPH:quinone reductase-like Zn-dependent oxidoreductase
VTTVNPDAAERRPLMTSQQQQIRWPGGPVTAAVIDAPGAGPHVGTMPLPARVTGTTLLQVLAAPLNPLDLVIASGAFHSARYEVPYVPGSECAGTVLESDHYAAGTRVYAECHASPATPGSLATHVVVSDDDLVPLPDGMDPVRGAAVGNSGITAFLTLVERARLQPGESVLILGATGAVGQLAVQVARRHGAGRIVGVGRDRAALDRLVGLGADAVVELRASDGEDDLAERLLAAGGAADVVLDGLYGVPLQAALRACAARARVVNIGNLAGATARLPAGLLRGKQLTMIGFAGLHTPLREKRAALEWLWQSIATADLRIGVRTFPLEELPAAWRAQQASPHAKCVIRPGAAVAAAPAREKGSDQA